VIRFPPKQRNKRFEKGRLPNRLRPRLGLTPESLRRGIGSCPEAAASDEYYETAAPQALSRALRWLYGAPR
jgi:hypothetical protein